MSEPSAEILIQSSFPPEVYSPTKQVEEGGWGIQLRRLKGEWVSKSTFDEHKRYIKTRTIFLALLTSTLLFNYAANNFIKSSFSHTEPAPIIAQAPTHAASAIDIPEPEAVDEVQPSETITEDQESDPILKWKSTVEEVIKDERLNIPQEDRDFWVKRILALIEIENKAGDPKAVSQAVDYTHFVDEDEIGLGLLQVIPRTARQIGSKYRLRKDEYDLFNPRNNIFFGLADQLRLSALFGRDLAGWAHHLGEGRMGMAIREAAIEEGDDPDEVDAILARRGSLEIVKAHNLTFDKLLSSNAVRKKLAPYGAFREDVDGKYAKELAVIEKTLAIFPNYQTKA